MDTFRDTLNIVSGFLFFCGFVPYFWAIIQGKASPSIVSWAIWATLDVILGIVLYNKGAPYQQIAGAAVGASITVILSMRYGTVSCTQLDRYCIGGAISGIALWWVLDNPTLAILVFCATIFLGSIPTLQSARDTPEKENKLAWLIFWISCVLAVAAIDTWTITDTAQKMTFMVVQTIVVCLLYRRRPIRSVS